MASMTVVDSTRIRRTICTEDMKWGEHAPASAKETLGVGADCGILSFTLVDAWRKPT